jgi:hypothetical protein
MGSNSSKKQIFNKKIRSFLTLIINRLKKSGKTIRRKILKMPCGATKSLIQQITILIWPEEGAYKEKWIAGGKALGGANEVVIDKIPKEKLLIEISEVKIITEDVKFPDDNDFFDEFNAQME